MQVDPLIFPADFYVLEMEDSVHSSPLPLLLGRPFMKTAQTKIDVAKGALTMEFGGDMIKFNVSESVENSNDVRSCFVIEEIKNIGQERSIKNDASRTTNEEGIGVEHKDHKDTAIHLAESTPNECVDRAATFKPSSQHIGKQPTPNPIPIKIDRWFPSLMQIPNQIPDGGRINKDFRKHNAPIRKDHYPLPFIDPMYENFEEHVVEAVPFHAVGHHET